MPKYDYQCTACGKVLEITQRMSDPPLTDCECGENGSLRRLLSAGSGLIFKGSGFYITDYKGGAKPDSSAPAETTKTESAPAAAAPAPAAPTTGGGGHGCGSGCGCA